MWGSSFHCTRQRRAEKRSPSGGALQNASRPKAQTSFRKLKRPRNAKRGPAGGRTDEQNKGEKTKGAGVGGERREREDKEALKRGLLASFAAKDEESPRGRVDDGAVAIPLRRPRRALRGLQELPASLPPVLSIGRWLHDGERGEKFRRGGGGGASSPSAKKNKTHFPAWPPSQGFPGLCTFSHGRFRRGWGLGAYWPLATVRVVHCNGEAGQWLQCNGAVYHDSHC